MKGYVQGSLSISLLYFDSVGMNRASKLNGTNTEPSTYQPPVTGQRK